MFSNNKKSKIIAITFTVIFVILISNAAFWQSYILDQDKSVRVVIDEYSKYEFKLISFELISL